MIEITPDSPIPSTEACIIVILATLVLGYGWSLVMERLARRAEGRWGPRALGSLAAGLVLAWLAFFHLTTSDGFPPGDAVVAFAIALAIAGLVAIGTSAVAAFILPGHRAAYWLALRSYTSGLLSWGFCAIFLAVGLALARFAAGLPD